MASIFNLYPKPRITIERAFEEFLEYQRTTVPGIVNEEYKKLINIIKAELNEGGEFSLTAREPTYLQSRREMTFCELFGPDLK